VLAPHGELVSAGSPPVREAAIDLVERRTPVVGFRPLSDDAWLRLLDGSATGIALADNDVITGWADVVERQGRWHVETVAADTSVLEQLLAAVAAAAAADGARSVAWLVLAADEYTDQLAASYGLRPGRSILQMRASLDDFHATGDVATRPFRVGTDDADWLRVNARAFATHPEQGDWTIDDLRRRLTADWFDADGFLLHERDGHIAAFCWTKIHQIEVPGEPALGEIYVIAVDPSMHGLGLGRALTVAGLRWLRDQGITEGMLHVEADNAAAVALYESLGFRVHRTDRTYTRSPDAEDPR
jgi:mycothiol synthase